MQSLRLLIVDDHSLFRESLARMLDTRSDFCIVGQCATSAEAHTLLQGQAPDIVLLDYDLGLEEGGHLLSYLRAEYPEVKVLLVTAGLSDEVIVRVIEAGAAGVFLKQSSAELLVDAIHQVAAGGTWFDEAALQSLAAAKKAQMEAAELSRPLTARQAGVLRGILDGLANKEIAWKLNMSESSVKAVIQELFRKAGVRTRSQLVRIAFEKHASDWLKSID